MHNATHDSNTGANDLQYKWDLKFRPPRKSQKADYQPSISERVEQEISPEGIKGELQSPFDFIADDICARTCKVGAEVTKPSLDEIK
jgi:hypothetical protein